MAPCQSLDNPHDVIGVIFIADKQLMTTPHMKPIFISKISVPESNTDHVFLNMTQ